MWVAIVWIFWHIVVPVALAYLGGYLLAPDPPEEEDPVEGAQSRSWNPRSTQTEGLARPRAYGRNMHHGNIVAKWTQAVGSPPNEREELYVIVEHGDGPTKGVGANLVYLNNQPCGNFGQVTVQERLGTFDQTCMTGFEKTKLEYKQGQELLYNEPYVFTSPNDFFDDLEFTLSFPQGLRHYHDNGSMHTESLLLRIRARELGGSWSSVGEVWVHGPGGGHVCPLFKQKSLAGYGYNCERGKQYEIELTKLNQIKEGHVNTCHIKSVREVVDIPFTRPGKALIGIRAVASAQLSGGVDIKVVREDRIINVYNGSTWTLEYSRNRAWVVWDVLTQPIISGNGAGTAYAIERYEGVDPENLDLEFFYKWAIFCDEEILDGYGSVEPRCACDIIVDAFTDVFTLSHKIAEVGRAHIYWVGHTLTGWIDTVADEPIDLVTMDSMMHRTWKNGWAVKEDLAGSVEVLYQDEKYGFEKMPAEFSSSDAGSYKNSVSIEGVGVKTRGTAIHFAHYLLERNYLIRNTNQFTVDQIGFRYKLGRVIRLQSKIANWGHAFKVITSTINTITVDRDVTDEVNISDVLHIRSWDVITEQPVTDTYTVDSVATNVITATENWDITPVQGNLVATGLAGEVKLRRIIALKPTIDNFFDVTVETYDINLFDADDLDPDNPDANYIWPGAVPHLNDPLTRAEVTDLIAQLLPPQPDIDIPWPSNTDWNDDTPSAGYISWSAANEDNPIGFGYKGENHEITPDSTDDKFIYWHRDYATVYRTTNLASVATAPGCWVMCINIDGVAKPANAQQLTHCGLLMVGTLRAETYLELRQTYVYNGDGSLDPGYPLEIPFRIVSDVIVYKSVKLSFKIMNFRAHSKAAVSGGGSTSGGWGGPTESAGPAVTQYGGTGSTSQQTAGGTVGDRYVASVPSTHDHGFSGSQHAHTGPNHTHGIQNPHAHQIGNHQHSTPDHPHTLDFGIYEESNSPTVHYHIDNGGGYGGASANYTTSQLDLVITGSLSGTGWKSIRFDTTTRCRIAVIIECQLDINAF